MKLSVITPTIGRDSLYKTCLSVDNLQIVYPAAEVEHIIIVDDPHIQPLVPAKTYRTVYNLANKSNNYGNTPKHIGWEHATGDFMMYLDDDDYFIFRGNNIQDLYKNMEDSKTKGLLWGTFPAMRMGEYWNNQPPMPGRTMSNQFYHAKYDKDEKPIRFPNEEGYAKDGEFIDGLQESYAFNILYGEPIVEVPQIGQGL